MADKTSTSNPIQARHSPGLLLCLILLTGCQPSGNDQAPPPAPPPKITVAKPIFKEIIDWDEFSGRLVSPQTVEVRARISGYIDSVHFKEGSEVEAGQKLYIIDPQPYQAVVNRMEAQVTVAKSRAELADMETKNADSLRISGALSSEEYERRLKASAEAAGSLRAAEADLEAAQLDLSYTEVVAPISGRISDARITKGNLVTGGTKEATLLTTIVSQDPMYCYIDADERSVLKYRTLHRDGKRVNARFGTVEAQMELTNETGFPHEGFMDFVDNQLDPATGTIRARAVFPNPDKLMAPGFFARIRIPGSGKYQAALILDRAIGDDQGKSFVWVIDANNKAQYRPVVIGPLYEGLRVVREGLTAEDRVVINGLMSVKKEIVVEPEEGEMKLTPEKL